MSSLDKSQPSQKEQPRPEGGKAKEDDAGGHFEEEEDAFGSGWSLNNGLLCCWCNCCGRFMSQRPLFGWQNANYQMGQVVRCSAGVPKEAAQRNSCEEVLFGTGK